MSLQPSARLGRYEIDALVGAGGMGEVYRARDTRLDRTVAVKVLPSDVANNPELCRRFEREGQVISRLNHPHICALYDVGNHDGTEYLVMEFLEGETLAKRLDRGRLPVPQVISAAREIAKALDAAHREGIVHRDLKPGNVMMTRSGAKLLDFGLAKLRDRGAEVSKYLEERVHELAALNAQTSSDAPTRAHPLTGARTVLGTAQYMAPEQIEGREADHRTDVFAFGVIVYEMATGRRAFDASTEGRMIGSILAQEPRPMRELDPSIPPALEALVSRCIAKDPDDRWQHVRDLLWHVESIAERAENGSARAPRPSWRTHAVWAVAALSAIIATGVVVSNVRPATAALSTVRAPLELPARTSLVPDQLSFAFSPDGRQFVYRSGEPGATQLFLRAMDTGAVQPIAGSENAHTPFFSPGSDALAFLSGTTIQRVTLPGGRPVQIGEVPSLTPGSPGATWGDDGTIVVAAGFAGLFTVSASRGELRPLTTPDAARGEEMHYGPQFLPGGSELLFMIRMKGGAISVALLSLDTRRWRVIDGLTDVVGTAGFVRTDDRTYLIYAQKEKESLVSRLRAVEIDEANARVNGGALQIDTVWVQTAGTVAVAHFSVSSSGTLAYVASQTPGSLVRVDRHNAEMQTLLTAEAHAYRYPRVSADGSRIAVVIEDVGSQVAIVEREQVRLLTGAGINTHPTWLDPSRLAIAGLRSDSDGYDVYTLRTDAADSAPALIINRPGGQFPSGLSRQTNRLAFYELGNAGRDIYVWSQSQGTVRLLATPANERLATFSKDGRFVAYVSDEGGRDEIWICRDPPQSDCRKVSTDGGTEPVWSPAENELFFRHRNEVMSVHIGGDGRPLGPPVPVLNGPFELARPEVGRPNYDVFPDGRHLVMVRSPAPHARIPMVVNWSDELQRQLVGK